MALSTETKAWLEGLKKEGNLSDEALKQLEQSLDNGKADDYVKGSQLRQNEFSSKMASVQAAQKAVEDASAALATKESQVSAYQTELGTWKAGADKNFQKAITERESALNKANAAMARLKSLAVANGLSEEDVLKDLDVTPPAPGAPKPGEAPFDTSQFVTRQNIQDTVRESALIDATIYDVAGEYQELTGKPLRGAGALVQEAIKAGKPLGEYIATKFDFAGLRTKASEGDVQRRIDEAVKAKETEILSRTNLPGASAGLRTDLKGSPIFDAQAEGVLKSAPAGTGGGGGVPGAVAAFNAGKFSPHQR